MRFLRQIRGDRDQQRDGPEGARARDERGNERDAEECCLFREDLRRSCRGLAKALFMSENRG